MQKSTDQDLEEETGGWEITLPSYLFQRQTWILILLVIIAIFLAVLLFKKAALNTQTNVMTIQSVQQKK